MDAFLDGMVGRFIAGVVIGLGVWALLKLNDRFWGF